MVPDGLDSRDDETDSYERPIPRNVLDREYVFRALGHPRRRYLLCLLCDRPEWSLGELSATVASWENGAQPDDEAASRTQVYLALRHIHVPKLIEANVIEFDPQSERITPAERAQQVFDALAGLGANLAREGDSGDRQ